MIDDTQLDRSKTYLAAFADGVWQLFALPLPAGRTPVALGGDLELPPDVTLTPFKEDASRVPGATT